MSVRPAQALIAACVMMAPLASRADMCFTVIDRSNRVIHQSRNTPVDLSRQVGDTLYQRFPGAALMVFGQNDGVCEEVRTTVGSAGGGAGGSSAQRTGAGGPDMTRFFNERRYAARP